MGWSLFADITRRRLTIHVSRFFHRGGHSSSGCRHQSFLAGAVWTRSPAATSVIASQRISRANGYYHQGDRKIDPGFSRPGAIEVPRGGSLIYNGAASHQKKDDREYQ